MLSDHPRIEQWRAQLAERILDAERNDIVAKGVIVDDGGQPLGGVDVKVVRSVARKMGWEVHDDKVAEQTVDHRFQFEVPGAHAVTLYFEKSGFYSQTIYLKRELFEDRLDQASKQIQLGPAPVQREELRVVMEKQGELVDMACFSGELRFHTDGRGQVFSLELPKAGASAGRTYFRGRQFWVHGFERTIEDFGSIADKIPHGISVTTAVEAARVPTEHRRQHGNPLLKTQAYPVKASLKIHDPEGGFLRRDYPDPSHGPEKVFRGIRAAPSDGYVQEWVLSAEDLSKYPYFFFRSRGHYGTGRISEVYVDEEQKLVVLHMTLRMNPGGTRSLETGE
jgi:hypothetical protein